MPHHRHSQAHEQNPVCNPIWKKNGIHLTSQPRNVFISSLITLFVFIYNFFTFRLKWWGWDWNKCMVSDKRLSVRISGNFWYHNLFNIPFRQFQILCQFYDLSLRFNMYYLTCTSIQTYINILITVYSSETLHFLHGNTLKHLTI